MIATQVMVNMGMAASHPLLTLADALYIWKIHFAVNTEAMTKIVLRNMCIMVVIGFIGFIGEHDYIYSLFESVPFVFGDFNYAFLAENSSSCCCSCVSSANAASSSRSAGDRLFLLAVFFDLGRRYQKAFPPTNLLTPSRNLTQSALS